jgi:hypothetical protein
MKYLNYNLNIIKNEIFKKLISFDNIILMLSNNIFKMSCIQNNSLLPSIETTNIQHKQCDNKQFYSYISCDEPNCEIVKLPRLQSFKIWKPKSNSNIRRMTTTWEIHEDDDKIETLNFLKEKQIAENMIKYSPYPPKINKTKTYNSKFNSKL